MSYVLLVDDTDENIEYLRALFSVHGFEVDSARNGVEALAKARRKPPRVVIADLLMPIMDGYTLLRHWKADAALSPIPFIVHTATYTDLEDERLAMDMGADAFIQKFVEPGELLERLERVLASTKTKPAAVPKKGLAAEEAVVFEYNAALGRKLESKTRQLHTANRALQSEIVRRREIAETQIGILDALGANVALIDSAGVIVAVNEAWRRHADVNVLKAENFGVGENYLEICEAAPDSHSGEARRAAAGIRAVLAGDAPSFALEYSCSAPTQVRWFRMTVTPLHSSGSAGAVIMHVEITDIRGVEQQLVDSEAQYLLLLNSTAEGIYLLDVDGVCTFCNPTAVRLLGYAHPRQIIGQHVHGHHHHSRSDGTPFPVEECKIHQAFRTGEGTHADDEVFFRADGTHFPVEYWSYPIVKGPHILGAVVTFLDITVRRNLEGQFLQAQKMEAVGRLAGGVAHDFNNALQVILTYGELLDERLAHDEVGAKHNQQIVAAGQRAASLTRQLLSFSRKQLLRPILLDLSAVIHDLEELLRRMIGEHIKLHMICVATGAAILADRTQVEQVLLNLAINAADAMPHGGELYIKTSNIDVGRPASPSGAPIAPGKYVMLTVRDTGTGMTAAIQERIFEPFFTTKDAGKGTGLGLSTVYGIVQQSKGYITVHSKLGKGSRFKVYFPIVEGAVGAELPRKLLNRPAGGTETILLVEDEDSLRAVVAETLRANGYVVLEAHDGHAGIEFAGRFDAPIDLLLTDVILPGATGREVAGRMLQSRPGLKVIYMSGYTDDFIAEHGIINPETVLLEKPFPIALLLLRVRETLDRVAAGGARAVADQQPGQLR